MSVTKADVTAVNGYLTEAQRDLNALYIAQYLYAHGWSRHAIAATLANMQAESGINPGIYESLNSSSTTNGFGLVQWTPNTKYKTWCDEHWNGVYSDIDGQLARIIYELDNGIQWIETDSYPLSFEEYSKSTADPAYLCYAFMYNYERPASLDQPHRKEYAAFWYTAIETIDGGGSTPSPSPVNVKKLPLIYQYIATRRRF